MLSIMSAIPRRIWRWRHMQISTCTVKITTWIKRHMLLEIYLVTTSPQTWSTSSNSFAGTAVGLHFWSTDLSHCWSTSSNPIWIWSTSLNPCAGTTVGLHGWSTSSSSIWKSIYLFSLSFIVVVWLLLQAQSTLFVQTLIVVSSELEGRPVELLLLRLLDLGLTQIEFNFVCPWKNLEQYLHSMMTESLRHHHHHQHSQQLNLIDLANSPSSLSRRLTVTES